MSRLPVSLAVLVLVAANLVPLVGVLYLGWSLFMILLVYWVENGIVGFFNVFKISLASKPGGEIEINGRKVDPNSAKFFLVPFFIFHYGLFWVVHGVFVIAFFAFVPVIDGTATMGTFSRTGFLVACLSLFLSHGASFFVNFIGRKEYMEVDPGRQMFQPYSRVVVLHLTVLGGGFAVASLGSPVWAIVVMVAVKIGVDIVAHLRERRAAAPPEAAARM